MSTIPPNIVGPILQAAAAQQQASRALEGERQQQSNAVDAGNKISDKATDTVGEADNDAQVHTDAEGGGSQGRFAGDGQDEQQNDDAPGQGQGIHRDDEGQLHLDLEA